MHQNDAIDSSSHSSEDDASPDNSDVEEDKVVKLSEIPFCELEELKQEVGSKKYNEAIHGLFEKKGAIAKPQKRENKNRPREMSSKKPVSRLRHVIPLARDPRFDELSGTFNQEKFDKAYSFLGEIKANEKKQLQKELQKTKQPERKQQLDSLLKRMDHQEAAKKSAGVQREAERKRKKAEMELLTKEVRIGGEIQKLKSSGKLEQYLKKRGKKNASKERKKMPRRRDMET
ncbi:rRNA biogenesis protein rrp36 [Desmophyllum pertusum]|uniref:rRNA biogenesis protein RRP36 n=1 Tax=Desmophyllum pertusum TaxID=174260 RepID=A0A9W9Z3M7_9CNID|nr:rRNA biogenesis protein rrp36 [Desmophyllum pertusum]